MAKKELIANDPMETRLMNFSETVRKIGIFVMVVLVVVGIVLGIAAGVAFGGDFWFLLMGLLFGVLSSVVVWLLQELICLVLEYLTEMHCYQRTQTEILMENYNKD